MDMSRSPIPRATRVPIDAVGDVTTLTVQEELEDILGRKPVSIGDLYYKPSELVSGLTVTYSGAADNYSVAAGRAIINGADWQWPVAGSGVLPLAVFQPSPSTEGAKDPYIVYENGTAYMFYTRIPPSVQVISPFALVA